LKIKEDRIAGGSSNAAAEARMQTDEEREYYRTCLNGMTVGRFRSLMNDRPELDLVYFYRKPLRSRLMTPLTHLPPFDELVTTLAVGIAKKK
jgi:hypothetical protein